MLVGSWVNCSRQRKGRVMSVTAMPSVRMPAGFIETLLQISIARSRVPASHEQRHQRGAHRIAPDSIDNPGGCSPTLNRQRSGSLFRAFACARRSEGSERGCLPKSVFIMA
jgi:hypothetical protein